MCCQNSDNENSKFNSTFSSFFALFFDHPDVFRQTLSELCCFFWVFGRFLLGRAILTHGGPMRDILIKYEQNQLKDETEE